MQPKAALAMEHGNQGLGWNAFSSREPLVLFSISGRRGKELAVPGAPLAAKSGWGGGLQMGSKFIPKLGGSVHAKEG